MGRFDAFGLEIAIVGKSCFVKNEIAKAGFGQAKFVGAVLGRGQSVGAQSAGFHIVFEQSIVGGDDLFDHQIARDELPLVKSRGVVENPVDMPGEYGAAVMVAGPLKFGADVGYAGGHHPGFRNGKMEGLVGIIGEKRVVVERLFGAGLVEKLRAEGCDPPASQGGLRIACGPVGRTAGECGVAVIVIAAAEQGFVFRSSPAEHEDIIPFGSKYRDGGTRIRIFAYVEAGVCFFFLHGTADESVRCVKSRGG